MTWQELYDRLFQGQIGTQPPGPGNVAFPSLPDPLPFDTAGLTAAQKPAFFTGLYSDWRDFLEQQRQFQQQSGESQRQFNLDMAANLMRDRENIRQFDTQFDESKRRWDWEAEYIPKRDAYSIAGAAYLPQTRFLTR